MKKQGIDQQLNKLSFPKSVIGNLRRLSFMRACRNGGCVEDPRTLRAATSSRMTPDFNNTPSSVLTGHLPPHGEVAHFNAPSTWRERAECVSTGVRGIITRGFTLIELLVVVLIIGILAAVALPQYQQAVEKSRNMQALITGKALLEAQQLYHLANGIYATSFEELDIVPPTVSGWRIGMYTDGHIHLVSDKNSWDFHQDNRTYCFAPLDRSDTEMLLKVCKSLTGATTCFKQQTETRNRWGCSMKI